MGRGLGHHTRFCGGTWQAHSSLPPTTQLLLQFLFTGVPATVCTAGVLARFGEEPLILRKISRDWSFQSDSPWA